MSDFANNILGNNFAAVQDATAHNQIDDLIDNNDLVDIDEQMNSILSQQPPLEQTISQTPFLQSEDWQKDLLMDITTGGAGGLMKVVPKGVGFGTQFVKELSKQKSLLKY